METTPCDIFMHCHLSHLPSFIRSSVVWVVLGDVGVDAGQSQLFVDGLRNCLNYQLGIRKWGL